MELNHTCLELLKILYDQQDYVTIGDLAEQLGKTERSVRYNLDTIDAFMKKRSCLFFIGNSAAEFTWNTQLKSNPFCKIFFPA